MDVLLITKYNCCISGASAGGHFEVDYNASVDIGGDADHNDVDVDHQHDVVGGCDVDYKIQLLFSGAELVDSVLDVVRKESESCDCLQVNKNLEEIVFLSCWCCGCCCC